MSEASQLRFGMQWERLAQDVLMNQDLMMERFVRDGGRVTEVKV